MTLLCMSGVLIALSQVITCQSLNGFVWCAGHLSAFLLGCVVVSTVAMLIYGIAGRLTISYIVVATCVIAMSLINFYKVQINGKPLLISEFSMAGEIGNIMEFALPQMEISPVTVLSILSAILIIAVMVLLDIKYKSALPLRMIILGIGIVSLIAGEVFGLYHLWGEKCENGAVTQSDRVERCGVITGLYCAWADSYEYTRLGISDETIQWINNFDYKKALPEEDKANVIFLMSESFFDITRLDNLKFRKDPLANFHKLAQNYSSGRFISTSYAGGTGNVEMEMLTGICGQLLKESDALPYLNSEVYYTMPNLGDVFEINGYRKEFLHSFSNELYNRSHIYDAWQFDSVRFEESFPATAQKEAGYISDMALSEEIISVYENKGEEPLMLFAVSMENHQPYGKEKYADKSYSGVSSDILDESELEIVDSLVHGLENADKALGYLVDYFSKKDEKTMIVFWGDHLPNLQMEDGSTIYEKLGYCTRESVNEGLPDELVKLLYTDYLIWTNYPVEKKDLPMGNTLFGLNVAKLLNLGLTDYFTWLDEHMADKYVMYSAGLYVDNNGTVTPWIPDEYKEAIDNYKAVIQNIVYDSNTLFKNYQKTKE